VRTREKLRFFADLASVWDERQDIPALANRLAAGLVELGVGRNEIVLDVGSGTGNLTGALLRFLGPNGRVVGCDLAPAMIQTARSKHSDPRIHWQIADAHQLPLRSASVDRVVCFSVWPHFENPARAAIELGRVLRGGGRLHVWHLASRAHINAIHAAASAAVQDDTLPPGRTTAELLREAGLAPTQVIDDESRYLVTAVKRAS